VTADYEDGYPVTVNTGDEVTFAEQTVADELGPGRFVTAPNPIPGAEDFSYVLNEIPGAYLMLGAVPAGADPLTAPFNHSAHAVFDDAAVPDGTALYAALALRRLTRGLSQGD
jgi:metal-dependent amidase/aminoacylase/carboxypeptidase family protein